MNTTFTSVDQLPLTLNATDVANILGISKANAYNLLNSEEFPTIHIGKRMLVSKDKLIRWLDSKSCNAE